MGTASPEWMVRLHWHKGVAPECGVLFHAWRERCL